jgi:hypothetical protein
LPCTQQFAIISAARARGHRTAANAISRVPLLSGGTDNPASFLSIGHNGSALRLQPRGRGWAGWGCAPGPPLF